MQRIIVLELGWLTGTKCYRIEAILSVLCAVVLVTPAVSAETTGQTDWSAGPIEGPPAEIWDGSFAWSDGVSWLAVPGQITLSGVALDEPVKQSVSENFDRPASLDAVDIDEDGDLDLVGAAGGDDLVSWWRNEGGQPPSWSQLTIESGFRDAIAVRAVDVNGDGMVDVVGCSWEDDEVAVWLNGGQGLSWTRQSVAGGFSQCHWVDAADLDGDGDIDLLGAAADGNTVAVWYNDGALPPAWSMQVISDEYRGARSLVPADLDGDGDVDVIGTALEDDDLSWWRNDGGSPVVWTRHIVTDSLSGSHDADAWDLDLDGDLDIVAVGYGSPYVRIYWNDGGDPVSWREDELRRPIGRPLVVSADDLDGDGDMDVAATSNNWDRSLWWQNDGGPPSGWPSITVGSQFTNAWPLLTADLDGNGSIDLAAGASGASEVAWWRLTDFAPSGSLVSRVLEVPDGAAALECAIEADLPAGTSVEVEVRVGQPAGELGNWTAVDFGGRVPLSVPGPLVLQYRLTLSTADPMVAPVVRSITFEWISGLTCRRSSAGRVSP